MIPSNTNIIIASCAINSRRLLSGGGYPSDNKPSNQLIPIITVIALLLIFIISIILFIYVSACPITRTVVITDAFTTPAYTYMYKGHTRVREADYSIRFYELKNNKRYYGYKYTDRSYKEHINSQILLDISIGCFDKYSWIPTALIITAAVCFISAFILSFIMAINEL